MIAEKDGESWDKDKDKSQNKLTENFLRKPKILLNIKKHFKSYCNSTSIHGFQYFGQNRTFIEKIYWFICFLLAVILCGYCILLIYQKWIKSPVIVSLATRDTPIYQIPFPAVTICPTIKYSQEKYVLKDILTKINNMENLSDDEITFFSSISSSFCPMIIGDLNYDYFKSLLKNKTLPNDFGEYLLKISPFHKQQFEITFMSEDLYFEKTMTPILTEDGACFTFNMIGPEEIHSENTYLSESFRYNVRKSEWIPQRGYDEDAGLHTFPRRALYSGTVNSLTIDFKHNEKDVDYYCFGLEQGYKIVLHMPTRVPIVSQEYILVPFNRATTISIIPTMISTSDMLRSYKPSQRGCYFPDEKKLKYFKIYSKKNCLLECLANYTLGYCGCVGFSMQRDKETPLCDVDQVYCLKEAEKVYNLMKLASKLTADKKIMKDISMASVEYYNSSFNSSENENGTDWNGENDLDNNNYDSEENENVYGSSSDDLEDLNARCFCLPACNDITFAAQTTSLNYPWKTAYKNIMGELPSETGRTRLHIFFKTNEAETIERNELYGPTDFLSNFGGLLGLFTGFSILSLLEIIYFISVRILGNIKLFNRWHGEPND